MRILRNGSVVAVLTIIALPAVAEDLQPLLQTLRCVGPNGAGNRAATRAWQELAQADVRQIVTILEGLDDAGPLAANWIRTAVDAVVQSALHQGRELPAADLNRFALDRRHAPRARRLAYELLVRTNPSARQRLVPGMLDDPSLELRREAVDWCTAEAEALADADKREQAIAAYRRALAAARDLDQIRRLAACLGQLGQQVNLPRHFGFLMQWQVIGPFDNTDRKGFDKAYPPEHEIDLSASYPGKHAPVTWTAHTCKGDYGRIDFNRALVEEKSVVGYAVTRFVSEEGGEVDLRATSHNAVKIWLNGNLVQAHHVYHTGSQMDQYTSRVELKAGANTILLKVCQNEITPDWARWWDLQVRICDRNGTAILSTDQK